MNTKEDLAALSRRLDALIDQSMHCKRNSPAERRYLREIELVRAELDRCEEQKGVHT